MSLQAKIGRAVAVLHAAGDEVSPVLLGGVDEAGRVAIDLLARHAPAIPVIIVAGAGATHRLCELADYYGLRIQVHTTEPETLAVRLEPMALQLRAGRVSLPEPGAGVRRVDLLADWDEADVGLYLRAFSVPCSFAWESVWKTEVRDYCALPSRGFRCGPAEPVQRLRWR